VKTKTYEELKDFIFNLPVIDCHEHTMGPKFAPFYKEPIASLIQGYFQSDLLSAGATEKEMKILNDHNITTEEKWYIFEKLWEKTEFTGYARVTKIIMEKFYGEKEINLSSLKRISEKLLNLRDEKVYYGILKKAKIKCRLVNILYSHTSVNPSLKDFIEGKHILPDYDRILIPLIMFHLPVRNRITVESIGEIADTNVNTLEKYLEACRKIFIKMKEKGAVGMKDQSAYERIINFENVSKHKAEKLFNFIIENPRNSLGWPEVKPLDDYLFHRFIEMAEELSLPVQIHTGHMAGIRNEISKTNAVLLTSILEKYKNVKFDLFHGNWPYMGELLFLAKNYPNVHIDLCWVNIIDPYYTSQLLCDALTSIPHSKIHGFGGDYGDTPEYSFAHLEIAKDVISFSLSKMVDSGWIEIDEAKKIAIDWLYNNPNEFFNLGFEPLKL